jgi:hypothetical protein
VVELESIVAETVTPDSQVLARTIDLWIPVPPNRAGDYHVEVEVRPTTGNGIPIRTEASETFGWDNPTLTHKTITSELFRDGYEGASLPIKGSMVLTDNAVFGSRLESIYAPRGWALLETRGTTVFDQTGVASATTLIIAPDLSAYRRSSSAAGLSIAFVDGLNESAPATLLDLVDLSPVCSYEGRRPWRDTSKSGAIDLWSCGPNRFAILEIRGPSIDERFVAQVRASESADMELFARTMDYLDV